VQPIKTIAVLHHRRITAPTHIGQDILHGLINRGVGHAFPGEQRFELRPEVRLCGG